MHRRWKEDVAAMDFGRLPGVLPARIREFLWESMPAQRRRRYGDAEYDWDHRVNTTERDRGLARASAGTISFRLPTHRARAFQGDDGEPEN